VGVHVDRPGQSLPPYCDAALPKGRQSHLSLYKQVGLFLIFIQSKNDDDDHNNDFGEETVPIPLDGICDVMRLAIVSKFDSCRLKLGSRRQMRRFAGDERA